MAEHIDPDKLREAEYYDYRNGLKDPIDEARILAAGLSLSPEVIKGEYESVTFEPGEVMKVRKGIEIKWGDALYMDKDGYVSTLLGYTADGERIIAPPPTKWECLWHGPLLTLKWFFWWLVGVVAVWPKGKRGSND